MSEFIDFILEYLKAFFEPIWNTIKTFFTNLIQIFNVMNYVEIFKKYCGEFNGLAWFLAILVTVVLIAAVVGLGFVIYLLIRKYVRVRKTFVSQE